MYNNLYKSSWVVIRNDDKRVIDNNALLEEKLGTVLHAASISKETVPFAEQGEFTDGLNAEAVDLLLNPEGSENLPKGALAAERDAVLAEIEQAKTELADLKKQAAGMIEDAKSQIGAMQTKAYEEARTQGYQEGERLGKQEAEAVKNEYLSKKKQLESAYEKKMEELEPEFIETLTGIYEHIFKVDLAGYHDLVSNLLINTMQKIESISSFLIHVSKEDYENVLANRKKIGSEAGCSNASVEIVEDMTLSCSQCYIETENGIYDCSLDTQLTELGRKLKLLSYTGN